MTDTADPKIRNPIPTVDVVIHDKDRGIVLVERKNYPHGWALPGGFVDAGECVEDAVVREAKEETGLTVRLIGLLGVYSSPDRDPRQHTMSVVFIGQAEDPDMLVGGDDAASARFFPFRSWESLAFDHELIIEDFMARLEDRNGNGVVSKGRSVCCSWI